MFSSFCKLYKRLPAADTSTGKYVGGFAFGVAATGTVLGVAKMISDPVIWALIAICGPAAVVYLIGVIKAIRRYLR